MREDEPVSSTAEVGTAGTHAATHALLYDSDCGFCKWSLDKILLWDRHGRLRDRSAARPSDGRCARR